MPCQGRSRRRRGPTASLYGAWRSAKLGHWDRRLNATQSGNFKPLVFGEIHAAGNTFTPKHGSWLDLTEGFFSKLARSVLRHIRVASKQELKDRIMSAIEDFNRDPVVHAWCYKLDQAA